MAKAKSNKKPMSKKMKRNMRWTFAGLFLLTAIVIALIPVQNGGVSATTESSVPGISDLSYDTSSDKAGAHALFTHEYPNFESNTQIKGNTIAGNVQYAFPFLESVTIQDENTVNHTYYKIDPAGMPSVPVPIYILGETATHDKTYINEYIGYNAGYNPGGTVSLSDTIIINPCTSAAADYYTGDNQLINDVKTSLSGRSVDGEYSVYHEEMVTQTAGGYNVNIFRVDVTRHTITLERDTDNNPVYVDELTPAQMYKYSDNPIPEPSFYVCKDRAEGVKDALVETINYISDKAFYDAGSLESITIPSNIKAVGNSAFELAGLSSANIDTQCKFIGDRAFCDCANLTSLSFSEAPGERMFIGDCAFANTSVEDVRLPKCNNLMIGSGAFYNCNKLKTVDFNNTNPSITMGCYVFAKDTKLTAIDLKNVGNLITHKGTGQPFPDEDTVGCGIFSGCSNLHEVTFDDNYGGTLTYGTFADCPDLYFVKFRNGGASFYNKPLGTVPESYESDFKGQGNNFHIWGDGANDTIHQLATQCAITYRYDLESGDHFEYYDANKYRYDFSPVGDGTYVITNIDESKVPVGNNELDIPYSICDYYTISQIGNDAASGLLKPTHVNIPDSVSVIGDRAFSEMRNVTKVYWRHDTDSQGADVPQAGELSIGADAFYKCDKLDAIHLRHYAFANDGTVTGYYDPNITNLGIAVRNGTEYSPFYTEYKGGGTDVTKIYGAMYDSNNEPTLPFLYCMSKSLGKCNNNKAGYITYLTDGPELLEAKSDVDLGENGEASLVSYPTKDSRVVVGTTDHETGKYVWDAGINDYAFDYMTVTEVIQNLTEYSPDYNWEVKENFEHIYVPKGITSIEDALVIYSDAAPYSTEKYFQNLKPTTDAAGNPVYTSWITLADVDMLPDNAFASVAKNGESLNNTVPSTLRRVDFECDMWDIGELPFLSSKYVTSVNFSGNENPQTDTAGIQAGNKSYRSENGIIYCTEYDDCNNHMDNTLVECMPGTVASELVPSTDITRIEDGAFENCDNIFAVNLSDCANLKEEKEIDPVTGREVLHPAIPDYCFYDADNINSIKLPESAQSVGELAFSPELKDTERPAMLLDTVRVRIPSTEVEFEDNSFKNNKLATLISYPDSAAERFANLKENDNVTFESLGSVYRVTFLDDTGKILSTENVVSGGYIQNVPAAPEKSGMTFIGWSENGGHKPTDSVSGDWIFVPSYQANNTSSSSTSKTTSSSSGGGGGSTSGGSTSSSKSTSSSSTAKSSSGSSSGSSTRNTPVVVSGAPAPYSGVGLSSATAPTGSTTAGGGNNVQTGNTNAVSTAGGLDSSKLSATVNGSSDNYVIKITETTEADELAKQALTGEFGSLDNIRYYPFDVSLYDSTGTQKISPVPDGVTVSVTMPIPDALTIYGGNNKIGSTIGGTLEKIQPKFTVIDGVPCMNFTVSHLSPYVVYVDTANLTAGGVQDATPKTADPIHPKWFLVIGFAAISIFLFLKRDKQSMPANVA